VHIPEAYGGDTFTIFKANLLHTALEDTIGESLMYGTHRGRHL
jgi:hypothetical protein